MIILLVNGNALRIPPASPKADARIDKLKELDDLHTLYRARGNVAGLKRVAQAYRHLDECGMRPCPQMAEIIEQEAGITHKPKRKPPTKQAPAPAPVFKGREREWWRENKRLQRLRAKAEQSEAGHHPGQQGEQNGHKGKRDQAAGKAAGRTRGRAAATGKRRSVQLGSA